MLAPPIARLEAITLAQINEHLVVWGHRMGPWNRPTFRGGWYHGLYHHDTCVAVTVAGDLIRERCAGFDRATAVELGRLCAVRPICAVPCSGCGGSSCFRPCAPFTAGRG